MTPNLNILWSPEIPHVSHFCSASFKKHLYNFWLTTTFGLCLLGEEYISFFGGEAILATKPAPRDPGFFRCRTPQAKSETTSNMIRTPHEVRKKSSTVNRFATIFTGCCQFGVMTTTAWCCTWRLSHDKFFGCFFDNGVWSEFVVDISLFKSCIYKYDNPLKGRVP